MVLLVYVLLLCFVMIGVTTMRKIILVFGFIGVFILGTQEALCQCDCAFIPGSVRFSVQKAFETSDIIFTGKIIEIEKGASPDEYRVKFKVKSMWKKDVGESVILRTYRVSCGFFGKKGEEYLVYAYTQDGMLTTNGCTRTTRLAEAAAELRELEEKGEKPIKIYEIKASEL